jgi:hypothetical protein
MGAIIVRRVDPETGISVDFFTADGVIPAAPDTPENRKRMEDAFRKFDEGAKAVVAKQKKDAVDFGIAVAKIEKTHPGNAAWLRREAKRQLTLDRF